MKPSEATCRAVGCGSRVHPTLLFCKKHWGLVPPDLKHNLYGYARAADNSVEQSECLTKAVQIIEEQDTAFALDDGIGKTFTHNARR